MKKPRLRGANASWEYRFEPTAAGKTRVTETWKDDRTSWPDPLVAVFDRVVTSGKSFPESADQHPHHFGRTETRSRRRCGLDQVNT
jgi:hypothetical protein